MGRDSPLKLSSQECGNGTICSSPEFCQFIRSTGQFICCNSVTGCCTLPSDCTLGYSHCCSSTCETNSCPSGSTMSTSVVIAVIVIVVFLTVFCLCLLCYRKKKETITLNPTSSQRYTHVVETIDCGEIELQVEVVSSAQEGDSSQVLAVAHRISEE